MSLSGLCQVNYTPFGSQLQVSPHSLQSSFFSHAHAHNIQEWSWNLHLCCNLQSFGGFCAVTYLSMAPGGLRHVLLTGGLPPVDDGCMAETVYRALYKRVVLQNAKFYERFPEDENIVRSIVLHLAEAEAGGVSLQAPIASPILLLDCSCFYSDCVLPVPLGLWSIKSVLLL